MLENVASPPFEEEKKAPQPASRWASFGVKLKEIASDRALQILLPVSLVLLVAWSFAVPIFEGPDEQLHWQYARHLHDTWSLPTYQAGFGEANSPPLYYILIAPLAVDSELPKFYVGPNGEGPVVEADGIVHPSETPVFQHTNDDFGKYWWIRLARLVSVLISVFTVLFSYLAGKEATGRITTGLLTGSLVAFLPQFTFRGINVSNDALVTCCSAISLYLFVRLFKRGFSWPLAIWAVVAISCAFLSKISAIFLPTPFLIILLCQKAPWQTYLKRLIILGAIGLAIVGPWALRNQLLYGDPFANQAMLKAVHSIVEIKPITSPYFFGQFPNLLSRSFVGVFGWMNLYLPEGIYLLFGILTLLAFSGFLLGLLKHKLSKGLMLVLATFPILNLGVVININLTFSQAQGRYMFPALAAIALLVALGLESIPFWSKRTTNILVGVLVVLNVVILAVYVIPAYWPAPSLT